MIFQYTWEMVLAGKKTQTRRLVFEGETSPEPEVVDGKLIIRHVSKANRVKWRWQGRYAVQPGRVKKAVAFIEIINIRKERLQELTEADAIAEGIDVPTGESAVDAYARLWEEMHGAGAWDRNPLVWVLEFKVVEKIG